MTLCSTKEKSLKRRERIPRAYCLTHTIKGRGYDGFFEPKLRKMKKNKAKKHAILKRPAFLFSTIYDQTVFNVE